MRVHSDCLQCSDAIFSCSGHVCSVAQLFPTLCSPVDWSTPSSSVYGLLQSRIREWVAVPSPEDLPNPGFEPISPATLGLADGFFFH